MRTTYRSFSSRSATCCCMAFEVGANNDGNAMSAPREPETPDLISALVATPCIPTPAPLEVEARRGTSALLQAEHTAVAKGIKASSASASASTVAMTPAPAPCVPPTMSTSHGGEGITRRQARFQPTDADILRKLDEMAALKSGMDGVQAQIRLLKQRLLPRTSTHPVPAAPAALCLLPLAKARRVATWHWPLAMAEMQAATW